jgi:hypothetical protein
MPLLNLDVFEKVSCTIWPRPPPNPRGFCFWGLSLVEPPAVAPDFIGHRPSLPADEYHGSQSSLFARYLFLFLAASHRSSATLVA